jgi:cellulose synthase/poly-beta-1,6-N-acetylglucosamine synthase-like glycosyltransferase
VIVAAYNESDIIGEKIHNTLSLSYAPEKAKYLFVSDGSIDGTNDIISKYNEIQLMHLPQRNGKINAIHRAMATIDTDIVVFTDANTLLNKEALIHIAGHYTDTKIGAVAGEKRVVIDNRSDATAGEGFYWRYESTLKRWDSELHSVVGAAGELFSIRTSLYEPVPADTILDDFTISMLIASRGYRIIYEPNAYATERPSENIKEELKRKIRIAAGGIQSILRLNKLLNPFRDPLLTFQYISHRVLRWTITPICMLLAVISNVIILTWNNSILYQLLFAGQLAFYFTAMLGLILERKKIRMKIFFIPYFFCVMNYAVLAGIRRYSLGTQSAMWEKAKRKS